MVDRELLVRPTETFGTVVLAAPEESYPGCCQDGRGAAETFLSASDSATLR